MIPPSGIGFPLVSVVLVSWNRRDDLLVALRSIRAQDWPNVEVVVVDNGSTDGTVEALRTEDLGPIVLHRAERNLGAAVARNLGLRLATGDFVAFMDSDAELLAPETLRVLVERLQRDPALGAVAPAIHLDAEGREPWFLGGYYLRGRYCDQPRTRVDRESPEYLSTCFSVWRTDLVRRLGGFDPALPYGFEDNDLSQRALEAGFGLAVDPALSVRHRLSPVSRIRPESDAWAHFRYDDRARHLLQAKRLGLLGWLREEAWQWSREGRTQRRCIYMNADLRRRRKLLLFVLGPIEALALWPIRRLRRGTDWIARAPLAAGRTERIG